MKKQPLTAAQTSSSRPQAAATGVGRFDLASKYRPRTFNDVVGQNQAVAELRAAFTTGNRPPSLLFVGPPGVGKTSLARLVAACLNCVNGPTAAPCGSCQACASAHRGSLPGAYTLSGATITAAVAEALQHQPGFPAPIFGRRHSVYLIEDVDEVPPRLITRLLKLLEEPPAATQFVLTSTKPVEVPRAVKSRMWDFTLKRIDDATLAGHLNHVAQCEQLQLHPSATERITRESYGSMRDALRLLERHLVIEIAGGAR